MLRDTSSANPCQALLDALVPWDAHVCPVCCCCCRPLQHGEVSSCRLLHDKSSGQSLGGALLTCSSKQAADAALQALQMLTLPGAEQPLEVRRPECVPRLVVVVVPLPD
jgi:hypothetical protein